MNIKDDDIWYRGRQEKGIVERIGTNKKGYWKITEGGVEVNQ